MNRSIWSTCSIMPWVVKSLRRCCRPQRFRIVLILCKHCNIMVCCFLVFPVLFWKSCLSSYFLYFTSCDCFPSFVVASWFSPVCPCLSWPWPFSPVFPLGSTVVCVWLFLLGWLLSQHGWVFLCASSVLSRLPSLFQFCFLLAISLQFFFLFVYCLLLWGHL